MTDREGQDGLALLGRDTPLRLLLIEDSSADNEPVRAMLEDQLPFADIHVETSLDAAMVRLASHGVDLCWRTCHCCPMRRVPPSCEQCGPTIPGPH